MNPHNHPTSEELMEIIISSKIDPNLIVQDKITHAIRISEKNKWTNNSVFILRQSESKSPTKIVKIISSELYRITEIPDSIFIKCGYKSKEDFKSQWDSWSQKWDYSSKVWVINFVPFESSESEYTSIEDLLL